MGDLLTNIALTLAVVDGHEWQRHPSAVQAKKQTRYETKARKVLAVVNAARASTDAAVLAALVMVQNADDAAVADGRQGIPTVARMVLDEALRRIRNGQ
jgi:hypothetical protein